ncbi:MAG: plastocyanin/azurin family copper-binding protein [bacterium]
MRNTILLASLTLAAACGSSSYTAPTGTTNGPPGGTTVPTVTTSVNIAGTAFNPAPIQVSPGAVVTWTNSDGFNHNVTFSSAAIGAIGDFATGAKSLTMPTVVGTYAYHCTIHPSMTGTVDVK